MSKDTKMTPKMPTIGQAPEDERVIPYHLTQAYFDDAKSGRLMPNVRRYTMPLNMDLALEQRPPSKYLEHFTLNADARTVDPIFYSTNRPCPPPCNIFLPPSFQHTEIVETQVQWEQRVHSSVFAQKRGRPQKTMPLWPYEMDGTAYEGGKKIKVPRTTGPITPVKAFDQQIHKMMTKDGGVLSQQSSVRFRERLLAAAIHQAEEFNKTMNDGI